MTYAACRVDTSPTSSGGGFDGGGPKVRPSRCDDEEDDEAAAAAAAEEEPEYSSDAMVAVLWRFRSTKRTIQNIFESSTISI